MKLVLDVAEELARSGLGGTQGYVFFTAKCSFLIYTLGLLVIVLLGNGIGEWRVAEQCFTALMRDQRGLAPFVYFLLSC